MNNVYKFIKFTRPIQKNIFSSVLSHASAFHFVRKNVSSSARSSYSASWFKGIEKEKIDRKKEAAIAESSAKVPISNFDAEAWEASLSEEDTKRLKVLHLEYDVLVGSGERVPEIMKPHMWKDIFDCPTLSKRKNMYKYYFVTENRLRREKEKKSANKKEHLAPPEIITEGGYEYVMLERTRNSIMRKIDRDYMNQFQYRRIYNALVEDQKILFDMDFDSIMRPMDLTNLIEQIVDSHAANKKHIDPFYFILCNMKRDGAAFQRFQRTSANTPLDDYPFSITEKSYLDLFPKEKLVYLTPNAPDVLVNYNHDDIYIIGGLVDKINTKPVTYAKAKREGIRMAKLPLDLHVKWTSGTKSLTIDQMIKIMLDIKWNGNWLKAFSHLPSRKYIPLSEWAEGVDDRQKKRYKNKFNYVKKKAASYH